MAVARNQITIAAINDGKGEHTFIRYSDDGGKTFTPAKPWVETGEYGNGRNLLNGIPWEVSFSTQKDFTVGPIGKVLVGSRYAVSFDVENSEAQNAVGDVLFWSQTYKSVIIVHFVADNTKRHVEFSFVMPNWVEDGSNSGFRVRFRKTSGSGTVTVSKAKLEIGDTATDWSPSPEDQQLGTTPGKYLGTLVWDKSYPSMDTSAYAWSDVQGIQGEKGEAAEVYRLNVVEETAKVNPAGVLYVSLSYSVQHIQGSKVGKVGNLDDFRVVCETDTHDSATVEKGIGFVCKYTMNDYLAESNRPSFFRVQLFRGNELLDERVVNVQLEAASYVDVVGDLRKTVSQHGRNISRIEQKADGISLKVEGMKNGVRNLLKGGRLNVSFSTYGLPSAFRLKLKPDTDYTLTVCGRISEDALKKGQTLRTYVFDKDWKWSASFGIQSISDTAASITFRIPADRHSPEDYLISSFPFPNQEPEGKNGEVTVSWIVLTEGTQAAASWIPAEGEKAMEVEARLENGEFRVKSDKTVFVDGNGKETVLIKDGKLSAELIDAVKLVAAGIRAQTIDAQNAVFRNITVEGESKFKGTIETEDGSIAGWKIKRGMIGYGVDSDGLSIFDDCLVYNFHKKDKQVIIGDSPLGVYFGKAISASFTNGVDDGMEKIGGFVDMKSSPAQANNYAVYAQGGTYGGFRRSLRVISDDAELKKWDSAVLFTGTRRKKITLPASPEDGEEFIVYIANYLNDDLEFATTDGSGVDFHHDVYETGTDYNMTRPIRKHVLHVVYSRRGNTWCIF